MGGRKYIETVNRIDIVSTSFRHGVNRGRIMIALDLILFYTCIFDDVFKV